MSTLARRRRQIPFLLPRMTRCRRSRAEAHKARPARRDVSPDRITKNDCAKRSVLADVPGWKFGPNAAFAGGSPRALANANGAPVLLPPLRCLRI
jgi:hypothetical protein